MSRNLFWLFSFGLLMTLGLGSCAKDTEYVNPYADWRGVNDMYLDSIVDVARHAPEGETWKIFKNYKLNVTELAPSLHEYDSVYVKYLPAPENGLPVGEVAPLYTDSVDAYYQGFLINGVNFDGNFSGELNLDVHHPTRFAVSAVIEGWITALQEMHVGEYVELYIPYQMAYGVMGQQPSIPGYSVLKFRVYIEKIIHPKGPDDYMLKKKLDK